MKDLRRRRRRRRWIEVNLIRPLAQTATPCPNRASESPPYRHRSLSPTFSAEYFCIRREIKLPDRRQRGLAFPRYSACGEVRVAFVRWLFASVRFRLLTVRFLRKGGEIAPTIRVSPSASCRETARAQCISNLAAIASRTVTTWSQCRRPPGTSRSKSRDKNR